MLEATEKNAAEATARNAFAGAGCVSGQDVVFSDDGSDGDGYDDGTFVDGGMSSYFPQDTGLLRIA